MYLLILIYFLTFSNFLAMMNFIKPLKSKESTQSLRTQAQIENERRLTEGMKTVLQPFGISEGNKLVSNYTKNNFALFV